MATEFGGRHELYEINASGLDRGNPSLLPVRRAGVRQCRPFGKGFAEACMAEYDLDGWKVPDLTDPRAELPRHAWRRTVTRAARRRRRLFGQDFCQDRQPFARDLVSAWNCRISCRGAVVDPSPAF